MHRCGPSPNARWRLGDRSRITSSGSFELLLVVVGGEPADHDAVVAPQPLPAKHDVAGHGAAQLLVDREVPQELVRGGRVELGSVDELLSQLRVGAQVQQAQRRLRRRGVDAARR